MPLEKAASCSVSHWPASLHIGMVSIKIVEMVDWPASFNILVVESFMRQRWPLGRVLWKLSLVWEKSPLMWPCTHPNTVALKHHTC